MTKLVLSLLKKHKRSRPWLALEMDIPLPSIKYKIKHGSWSFSDFMKIIEVFNLTDDEILSYMRQHIKDVENG